MPADGFGAVNPQEIAEAISAVKDQLVEAVQQASERLELERRMRENPWMVLGVAAGAGFLLGGARTALSPPNLIAVAAALGALKAAQAGQPEAEPETEPPTPTSH
jgi:hypothetical protein